jgi:hypothetical protein
MVKAATAEELAELSEQAGFLISAIGALLRGVEACPTVRVSVLLSVLLHDFKAGRQALQDREDLLALMDQVIENLTALRRAPLEQVDQVMRGLADFIDGVPVNHRVLS